MNNVTNINGIDVEAIKRQAAKEVSEEINKKAVDALKKKYRDLENAKGIVRNIEREITDLEASISDGSFAGNK